jgi:hypothetical protein
MRIFQNNRSIEAGSESTFDRRASSSRKYIQRPAEEVCRLAHLKHRIALSHLTDQTKTKKLLFKGKRSGSCTQRIKSLGLFYFIFEGRPDRELMPFP